MNFLSILFILFNTANFQTTNKSTTTKKLTSASTVSYIFAQNIPLVYYCPIPGSIYTNATGTPHCYQSIGTVLKSNYKSSCSSIGSNSLNVVDIASASEIISILQYYGFYGTWVDAGLNNGTYIWKDGRPLPTPYQWCPGAKKTFTDVVLVCIAQLNSSFSMNSCCLADRNDNVTVKCVNGCTSIASKTWAGICMMNAILDSCEFIQKRTLDQRKFRYINSIAGISVMALSDSTYNVILDPQFNYYCCNLCQKIANCTAYNNWRSNDTCDFYQNIIPISDLLSVVNVSRSNVYAGLRLSEEIKTIYLS